MCTRDKHFTKMFIIFFFKITNLGKLNFDLFLQF